MARIVEGRLLPAPEIDPAALFDADNPQVRLNCARHRLREIDWQIAAAVMHHLLSPPTPEPPRDELMVLPGQRP